MSKKGFGFSLSELEICLLRAFDLNGELVMPAYSLRNRCSSKETYRVIGTLVDRKIVIRGKPFRLTKLGKKLKAGYE
jgi:hypothetical protein